MTQPIEAKISLLWYPDTISITAVYAPQMPKAIKKMPITNTM